MKDLTNQGRALQRTKSNQHRLRQLADRYRQAFTIQGALLRLSELASTVADMEEFYPAIHQMVAELLHAKNFYVVLHNQQQDQFSLEYFSDEKDQQVILQVPSEAFSSGLTGYVFRTAKPLLCNQTLFEQLIAQGDIQPQGSMPTHWMGIPLQRGQQVIGVMAIQSYDPDKHYNADDLDIFCHLGHHTVTAIDRVRSRELLEQTVRERTRQLQQTNLELQKEIKERTAAEKLQSALYRISELSACSRNMPSFYRDIHQVLSELMYAENCYIALLDSSDNSLSFPFYRDQYTPAAPKRPLGKGFTEYIIRHGEAALIDSAAAIQLTKDGEITRGMVTSLRTTRHSTSWLGAPLILEDEVIGVIALQAYDYQYDYSEQELRVLRFVSRHIAVAIQRKLATEQQRKQQEELERKVFERTRELRQTNLFLRLQVEERKKIEERLFHEANHDALTGLANRPRFLQLLQQQFRQRKRQSDGKLALLFIDLDRFKAINDNLGHAIGDHYLVETSKRLQQAIREHDVVARLGGDEFVVMLTDIHQQLDVEDVADRIIEAVRQPVTIDQHQVRSGASIGIALYHADYQSPDEMLRDADAAMYQAKSMGSNRFVLFSQEMLVPSDPKPQPEDQAQEPSTTAQAS